MGHHQYLARSVLGLAWPGVSLGPASDWSAGRILACDWSMVTRPTRTERPCWMGTPCLVTLSHPDQAESPGSRLPASITRLRLLSVADYTETEGTQCEERPLAWTHHADKSEVGTLSKLFVRENCYNTQLWSSCDWSGWPRERERERLSSEVISEQWHREWKHYREWFRKLNS